MLRVVVALVALSLVLHHGMPIVGSDGAHHGQPTSCTACDAGGLDGDPVGTGVGVCIAVLGLAIAVPRVRAIAVAVRPSLLQGGPRAGRVAKARTPRGPPDRGSPIALLCISRC